MRMCGKGFLSGGLHVSLVERGALSLGQINGT